MSDCIINPITGRAIKKTGATYKQLVKKENASKTLQSTIKRKLTKKPEPEKKKEEASKVLQGAVKRKLAKKPEPPKKFGFEDLPSDVKRIISGNVKQNKNRKDMIKDAKEKLKGYKLAGYTKMTNEELYDWVYGGKLDEAVEKLDKKNEELERKNYEKEMNSSFHKLYEENYYSWNSNFMAYEKNYSDNVDISKKDGFDLLSFLRRNEDDIEMVDAYLDDKYNSYLLYHLYGLEKFIFEIIPKEKSRLSRVYDTDGWTNNKIKSMDESMNEFLKKKGFKINGLKINYLTFSEWQFKNKK